MICYQNYHKEEDKSNYNELTMLPKATISVLGSFGESRETGNSEETGNSQVQTLSFVAMRQYRTHSYLGEIYCIKNRGLFFKLTSAFNLNEKC